MPILSRLLLTSITVDTGLPNYEPFNYTPPPPSGSPQPPQFNVYNFGLALDPDPSIPGPYSPPNPGPNPGPSQTPVPQPQLQVLVNTNAGLRIGFEVRVPRTVGLDAGLPQARQEIADYLRKISADLVSQLQE